MQKRILAKIKEHSLREQPKECAGFVVQNGRKLEYIECANIHENPTEHFRISGEDYAAAEDAGEIVRIIHSHPGDGARPIPSDLDVQQCSASGVVWGIYAPDCDEYAEIEPEQRPLIGRSFILGHDDCYGLVMDWHKTQGIELPDFRVNYPWWEQGENLYMDNWEKAGFVESELKPGCMVIMQDRSPVPNHAGIITDDMQLLHHVYGQLSAVIPYQAGYYRERTVICLRHKDLTEELKPWRD